MSRKCYPDVETFTCIKIRLCNSQYFEVKNDDRFEKRMKFSVLIAQSIAYKFVPTICVFEQKLKQNWHNVSHTSFTKR